MGRHETEDPDSEADQVSSSARRIAVRDRYGAIATTESEPAGETESDDGCCSDSHPEESSCCGEPSSQEYSTVLGYDDGDLSTAPEDANLGLGCGNPKALAGLSTGETVLDLGSGGGFDCFLAAHEVGPTGRVIGVDMTPEMVERARETARRQGFESVEFRLGEIEHLPVPDEAVDVIMSNCVINLSPETERVFEEAFRVLKPGGRLAISDIVMTPEGNAALDPADLEKHAECVSGAATVQALESMIEAAGFEAVSVRPKDDSDAIIQEMFGDSEDGAFLQSANIEGVKPPS